MRIVGHRLRAAASEVAVDWNETPNKSGAPLTPQYLVIHYTAGRSYASSVAWLTDPKARASAHLVIGRDGQVAQLAAFNEQTWHAGESRWRGLVGLNKHSIGIELDNAGPLTENASGTWSAWFGGNYAAADVIAATHKHGSKFEDWHRFTDVQIERALDIAGLLVGHYGLLDVIGHDDIAPGRKLDPGPAFPMDAFRSRAMGRGSDDLPRGRTTTELNIRSGPGAAYEKISTQPLAPGTFMIIRARQGSWLAVDVLRNDQPFQSGWVHGDYVEHT